MLDRIRALWVTEPVLVVSSLVAVIVFVLAKLGVVVDPQNVGEALTIALPILLGGAVARHKVSPAIGPVGPPSDSLLPHEVLRQPPVA